jgi:tRNA A-37 threonylcarbamoyl transferase component Bud32
MSSPPASSGRAYQVHEVLGRGGFGTVYRADLIGENGFTKPVALKVLHADAAARADHLARLRDEARMLGLIRHRALVGADALVRLDERWTVVMEYVPGVSLRALAKRLGALPEAVVVAVAVEVADALHAAYHAELEPGRPLKLVHRDLKPSNLQLTADGELKVLDFGVARAEFDEREAETRQVVYGSPPYLSPERLEGVDTHQGDIFALGISIGELLSGRNAHAVVIKPDGHQARIDALLEGLSVSPALGELLHRMLAYEHSARPDAAEVLAVLQPLAHRSPGALRTWAREAVPAERRAQGEMPGELTGQRLGENSTSASLAELAAGALATWDDPAPRRPVPDDASATWDADLHELPAPVDITPTPAALQPPAPAPRRRLWPRVLLALGTVLVVVGVVVVGGLGLAGLTAASAGVAALGFVDDLGCQGAVQSMNERIDRCRGDDRYQARARELLQRAERACVSNELGVVGAALLETQLEKLTDDRSFDRDDYQAFRSAVDGRLPRTR